jgi:hypothetical protein
VLWFSSDPLGFKQIVQVVHLTFAMMRGGALTALVLVVGLVRGLLVEMVAIEGGAMSEEDFDNKYSAVSHPVPYTHWIPTVIRRLVVRR